MGKQAHLAGARCSRCTIARGARCCIRASEERGMRAVERGAYHNGTCSAGDSEASIATKSFERRGRGLQNTDQIAWQDLASECNPLNNYSLNTLPRGMIMMDAIMMTMIIIIMVDG